STGTTSSESLIAPPPDGARDEAPDETIERPPAPERHGMMWSNSALVPPPLPPGDDWVVTNVAEAIGVVDADEGGAEILEDGTPIEGVAAAPAGVEASFVAGEIDVPTPPSLARDHDTPAVEFTAASAILGQPDPDPDTGSRTPPIERR